MNPLSTIVGPLVAANALSAVTSPIAQSAKGFAEVLSHVLSNDEPEAADDAKAENPDSLLRQLSDQVRQLLGEHHPFGESISVELSPLGNVYISEGSLAARQLEATVADNAELTALFQKYADKSGQSQFDLQLGDRITEAKRTDDA